MINSYKLYSEHYYKYKEYIYKYKQKRYKLNKIKLLRSKLKKIKTVNCIHKILNEITFKNSTADDVINKLYICYLYEPPTDLELQIITILYQEYLNNNNLQTYLVTVLWSVIFHYAENLPKIYRQKTWP